MRIFDFDPSHRGAAQGDLYLFRLTAAEAAKLAGASLKHSARGTIRLLEGEVTGHHHEVVMDRAPDDVAEDILEKAKRDHGEMYAAAVGETALAVATATAAAKRGSATLYQDDALAGSLAWLQRTDLMIGFLVVSSGPVVLRHPEHDAVRLQEGTYYVGRQIESAGAEERVVAD